MFSDGQQELDLPLKPLDPGIEAHTRQSYLHKAKLNITESFDVLIQTKIIQYFQIHCVTCQIENL